MMTSARWRKVTVQKPIDQSWLNICKTEWTLLWHRDILVTIIVTSLWPWGRTWRVWWAGWGWASMWTSRGPMVSTLSGINTVTSGDQQLLHIETGKTKALCCWFYLPAVKEESWRQLESDYLMIKSIFWHDLKICIYIYGRILIGIFVRFRTTYAFFTSKGSETSIWN